MKSFKLRGIITDCMDIDLNPDLGFNFPFKIIIPKNIHENPRLIYACNLPRDNSSNVSSFEELIECAKNDFSSIDPMLHHLCLDLGNPMVVPAIPRFSDFRPNFLGRDCFINDFSKLSNSKFSDYLYKYVDLADQHKSMILYAIKCLNEVGINIDSKVVIAGYSEGAKFASHFSLLHPEVVKGVIAGGTGGAISMPIKEFDGYEFIYPTGVSDVDNFDFNSFKDISFFYYMGDEDKSDSAIPNFEVHHYLNDKGEVSVLRDECGNVTPYVDETGNRNFILDANGNYTAKFNLFSDQEVNSINKVLGTVIQKRFKKQEQIYNNLGLTSEFHLYPGNHKTIFDNKIKIFEDVDDFILANLTNDIKRKVK